MITVFLFPTKKIRISKLKNAGNIKEDYCERLLEVVNTMISFFEGGGAAVELFCYLRWYQQCLKMLFMNALCLGSNSQACSLRFQDVSDIQQVPDHQEVFADTTHDESLILEGNSSKLEGRPLSCRLSDKANDQLRQWFEDDDALERAINGEWILLPCGDETGLKTSVCLLACRWVNFREDIISYRSSLNCF
ncbi:uncharacterized protein LOC130961331 isoform X2 [Arachis stenosperma]|nr:uncharacterized protein LOC130961331 isoform X2 [Arachis stenosperma]